MPVAYAAAAAAAPVTAAASLDGAWRFRIDATQSWTEVTVPHTWQIAADTAEYYGVAWYERAFDVPAEWSGSLVRIEFEAVFHSASLWVNGAAVGEHARRGYTAFAFDVTPHLKFGARNTVRVRVDNAFHDEMLPRGRSSDWTHDGGIYRPVRLLVTPKTFVERVEIEAAPSSDGKAQVSAKAIVRNPAGTLGYEVVDLTSGLTVLKRDGIAVPSGGVAVLPEGVIEGARLWHFDHPHLYEMRVRLSSGHEHRETFGIRSIEVRNGGFYLNGERVQLMGVERMAGSNPEFGMAEPPEWIEHDHADMLALNCIYTRVHWPQDRRLLDWCDRHGILIQTEVPTWGPKTFDGMKDEPSPAIMENGLSQLREMIERDRNHPCIFSWGLCNEIGGQNPAAYNFAKRMYEEAKKLDPRRLATYASNSLQQTPAKDAAGLMDYIMWNEYYESWYKGSPADLARNLDEIHAAFPGKPVVVSEYGYCACTEDRPEGDARRVEILREHDRIFRERDYVAGLIFFCYNDYRTHIGDRGLGVMKQRVHGVVDVYGNRKPSYEELRRESSSVEALEVSGAPSRMTVTVRARKTVPAYTMSGYRVRAVLYGQGDIPLERASAALPVLKPGGEARVELSFREKAPMRVEVDVLRPTGFSAYTRVWKL